MMRLRMMSSRIPRKDILGDSGKVHDDHGKIARARGANTGAVLRRRSKKNAVPFRGPLFFRFGLVAEEDFLLAEDLGAGFAKGREGFGFEGRKQVTALFRVLREIVNALSQT